MKKVGIGIVIIVGLAVLAIGQRAPKNTAQDLPSMPSFSLADVAYLQIRIKNEQRVQAVLGDGKWLLVGSGIALNDLAVDQLLHDLQTMHVKRVVAHKTELFRRFDVDENQIILKDKADQILFDVFVGSPATDMVSTYIRFANETRVVTVDKVLTWQVKRTQQGWLAKKDETNGQQ